MVNRRDLFKLFGAGATVCALDKGVPLLAEPARLILPATVEPAEQIPPVTYGCDGIAEIAVSEFGRKVLILHASTFRLEEIHVRRELREFSGAFGDILIPAGVRFMWTAHGEAFGPPPVYELLDSRRLATHISVR